MRRLGDALLCTALIRSVRRAWPDAQLEVLVNTQSAPALEGNPDIDRLWTLSERPSAVEVWRLVRALWRRYDLAVSALYNDRPHLWALLASGCRAGVVPPDGHAGSRWKRWACQAWTALDLGEVHTVEQYLRLADAMGIARVAEVVPPRPVLASAPQGAPYAVVHPTPQFRYKEWTLEGWRTVVAELIERGLSVVLTAGPAARDGELVQEIVKALLPRQREQVVEFRGRAFADLTPLIEAARVYVGPDTSVTHLAAATGTPTVALFGPSPTFSWGPWPQRRPTAPVDPGAMSPWRLRQPDQQAGNVWLVQGEGPCVPCLGEGCEGHLQSRSRCLDELDARRVLRAIDAALARPASAAAKGQVADAFGTRPSR